MQNFNGIINFLNEQIKELQTWKNNNDEYMIGFFLGQIAGFVHGIKTTKFLTVEEYENLEQLVDKAYNIAE